MWGFGYLSSNIVETDCVLQVMGKGTLAIGKPYLGEYIKIFKLQGWKNAEYNGFHGLGADAKCV
jgi:hypothetical protein